MVNTLTSESLGLVSKAFGRYELSFSAFPFDYVPRLFGYYLHFAYLLFGLVRIAVFVAGNSLERGYGAVLIECSLEYVFSLALTVCLLLNFTLSLLMEGAYPT